MFDLLDAAPVKVEWGPYSWGTIHYSQLDDAKAELAWLEAQIARCRARQSEILSFVDEKKVTRIEAARSLEEWTAANLDVAPSTARDLATAARTRQWDRDLTHRFQTGDVTFDRAVATAQLIKAGGDATEVAASSDHDLTGVRRRTAELKRITPVDEAEVVRRRHLTITPTLDHGAWNITGLLPGYAGHLVAQALQERADQFPPLPDGGHDGLAQRQADALTALALDSLDRNHAEDAADSDLGSRDGAKITVFVDAADFAATGGERGATISCGPRIGPETLKALLCEGSVGLIGLDHGRPVITTRRNRTIPPAVRAFVLHRDQGCVIDGCRSRYRLQVHHITHYGHHGDHDPDNLVTLCWYHHHIAVHDNGHHFQTDTPPRRRRLTRRPRAPDPL